MWPSAAFRLREQFLLPNVRQEVRQAGGSIAHPLHSVSSSDRPMRLVVQARTAVRAAEHRRHCEQREGRDHDQQLHHVRLPVTSHYGVSGYRMRLRPRR